MLAQEAAIQKVEGSSCYIARALKSVFTLRLLISVPDFQQTTLKDYWKIDSHCPYEMPLGARAFAAINAHIDGSTRSSQVSGNFVFDFKFTMCRQN